MKNIIKIGTRKSKLALIQTDIVKDKIKKVFPEIEVEIVKIDTKGDQILDKSLTSFGGKGVFTAELEAELAEAKAQAAAPQEIVTVDAALWENSCKAACTVLVEIMGNGETGITRDNFLERMRAIIPGKRTHTKADKIAWATLPDRYKNGPGCPKK